MDEYSRKIIIALTSACNAVGYDILFEGVDSKEGIDLARENDATFIQGFVYSKPLDWDTFVKFVSEYNIYCL